MLANIVPLELILLEAVNSVTVVFCKIISPVANEAEIVILEFPVPIRSWFDSPANYLNFLIQLLYFHFL